MKIPPVAAPAIFYDPRRDGVTFSLLNTFKTCREKAKNVLEAWTSDATTHAIVFGNVCHEVLRRTYDEFRMGKYKGRPTKNYLANMLTDVEGLWRQDNPRADAQDIEYLELTMLMLQSILPLYVKHWATDFETKKWERLESEFRVPAIVRMYTNRFGKPQIWLDGPYDAWVRGKMDGSFRAGKRNRPRLFETKTRGRINDDTTGQILPFEMQVNIYLGALRHLEKENPSGVLYNIIRRPQLRQKKSETLPQFAARIHEDVKTRPEWYFVRLQMDVSKDEIKAGMADVEGVMADFLAWWDGHAPHYRNSDACEGKFGACPFLKKCSSGDTTGLYQRKKLFRELDEM